MIIKITDTSNEYGVGKLENGKTVFIPKTLSGDEVEISIVEEKKNFAYGSLIDVIKSSEKRINPTCKYASLCGGCSYAHIDYEYQIEIKLNAIKKSLRNYKHELPAIETIKSHTERYRLRATFLFNNTKLGMNSFKSNSFVEIDDCLIVKESIVKKIKTFLIENNLTNTRNGKIYAIENEDSIMLGDIENYNIKIKTTAPFNGIISGKHLNGIKESAYKTPFGNIGFGCSTFFQANRFLLSQFQSTATDILSNAENAIELYAGSGFFTSALINKYKNLRACEWEKKSCLLASKYNYPIEHCPSEKFISSIKETDAIFLDPPREGLDKSIIENIIRLLPKEIVYVSCDTMTFARDVIKLENYYSIEKLTFFDMFPNTNHIEMVCLLSRL